MHTKCTPTTNKESSKDEAKLRMRLAGMSDLSVKFTLGWDQQLLRNSCPKLENVVDDEYFEESGKQQRERERSPNDFRNKGIRCALSNGVILV
jgi:hypothetical protein